MAMVVMGDMGVQSITPYTLLSGYYVGIICIYGCHSDGKRAYKVSLPYYYYQLIGCYVGFIAVVNPIANLYHGLRQFVVTYMQVCPVSCGYQHTYKTFLLIAECCKTKKNMKNPAHL